MLRGWEGRRWPGPVAPIESYDAIIYNTCTLMIIIMITIMIIISIESCRFSIRSLNKNTAKTQAHKTL